MKAKPNRFRLFAWIVAASVLLSACSGGLFANNAAQPTEVPVVSDSSGVTAEGRLMPNEYANLSFTTGGEVAQVAVAEGQLVKKGDLLVSLGKREKLQAVLTAAQLEQKTAQQQLDELLRTAGLSQAETESKLTAAQLAVSQAQKTFDEKNTEDFRKQIDDKAEVVKTDKKTLQDALDELDKYKDLATDNQTRKDKQKAVDDARNTYNQAVLDRDTLQNEKDAANAALNLALAQLAEAQHQVDVRKNGPSSDDLALAQARVDNAAAQLAAAQRGLEDMDLKAPFDGRVVDLNRLAVGKQVAAGQTTVTLADLSNWVVETKDLTELDAVKLSLGQKVTLTPDALPELKLTGEIESIANNYTEKSGDVLYTIRVRLNESDPRLRWGMTVSVKFIQ